MKKTIFAILIAFASTAFAEPSISLPLDVSGANVPLTLPVQDTETCKKGFYYIRFSAAESDIAHPASLLPGLGIGYRRLTGNGAADISVNGIGHAQSKNTRVFWTAPKSSYIRYLKPNDKASPYLGAGLAWGGIASKTQKFIGIIPSAIVGYEFLHKSEILSFTELNISQPALAVYQKGKFSGPCAELTFGMGF